MLLSILGLAAQEESLSISKNLKWSYCRRMKSGNFITCSAPIGYILKNKTLIPDPQEVPIVEYIFSSYLAGKSIEEIATEINTMEIEISGKKTKRWHRSTIQYILSNEKYIGDALVQKWFTPDELPLKHQRNDGKVSQYYIKNSHPAIIPRDIFETVQQLLKQKAKQYVSKTPKRSFPLSRTMQCALCGSTFRRRPNTKAIRWTCYQHLQSKDLCPMEIVQEEEVYQAFLRLYGKLLDNRSLILETMLNQLLELQAKTTLTKPDIIEINEKISELVAQNHSLTRLQTKGYIDSATIV